MVYKSLFLIFLLSAALAAQGPSAAGAPITAAQLQSARYACDLQIEFDPADAKSSAFFGSGAPGADLSSYSLYVVLDNNTPAMRACDKSHDYIDPFRSPDAKPDNACIVPPPTNPTVACPFPGQEFVGLGKAFIPLLKPLRSDLFYLLVVRGFGPKGDTVVPIALASSVITPDVTKINSRVMVLSNVALFATNGQKVTVERATAQGLRAIATQFSGHVINAENPSGVVLDLDGRLPSGQTSQLTVKGLSDYYGMAVQAKGKIQIAGAPLNMSDAFITTSLSATAGVHMTPAFGATGAIAPWHPAVKAIVMRSAGIRFDPSANVDVGSASLQTKNSVVIPAPLSLPIYFGLPSIKAARDAAGESQLVPLVGKRPLVLNLTFGPRLEIDTKYGGTNVLGEGRTELYVPRFSQTESVKQASLGAGNPAIRDLLELPANGFAFAPYFELDGGSHVNSQVVKSGNTQADVPIYDIARTYLGVNGSIQRGILTFSFDTSYVDLLSTETVAYVSNKVVLLRVVSGWQPNTTVGVSAAFDKAKHYAVTLTYQNGRAAPNFQYLNKVSGGVKITY